MDEAPREKNLCSLGHVKERFALRDERLSDHSQKFLNVGRLKIIYAPDQTDRWHMNHEVIVQYFYLSA